MSTPAAAGTGPTAGDVVSAAPVVPPPTSTASVRTT